MLRIPFFGLLAPRSPMQGLVDHYDHIAKSLEVIEESLECYFTDGTCPEFLEMAKKVNTLEDEADKVKRQIRNHLPRGLFMPVDKVLFFDYTRRQDNILDWAQDALNWLSMRPMDIPEDFRKGVLYLLGEVTATVELVKPALEATIDLVHARIVDRAATKDKFRAVRTQHKKVVQDRVKLRSDVYNSDMDFKDIHQLSHFVHCLYEMSHNAESCADILRAMIAR